MIRFDNQFYLYDVTPLENMFIQQYLVKSPGDYVKVYVFCLNNCYFPDGNEYTYDSLATALKLTNEDIKRSIRYWSRLGLMSVDEEAEKYGKLEITMHSIKDMLSRTDFADTTELYKYAEFNLAISEVFMPRILDTQDFLLYQDMITTYEVSEDYVIEAARYSVKTTNDVNIPYKYVEKVIEAWKAENVNDVEGIKKHLEKNNNTYRELCSILKYLGMNRAPTIPEINCYKKWIDDYKFTFESIKEACNSTLNANNPTIKYLDSVLMGLYEKKATTPEQITTLKENNESYNGKVRKLLYYLGLRGSPSAVQVQKFKKWEKEYGYDEDTVSIAASLITDSKNPFETLDGMLEVFHMNGVKTSDDMLMYISQRHLYDDDIKQIKKMLGNTDLIEDRERELAKRWREVLNMPQDVILYAAGLAVSADKPWNYIGKVLDTWSKNNIKTVNDAKAYNEGFAKATDKQPTGKNTGYQHKKYSFADIEGHKYSEEDFNNMLDSLDEDLSNE